VRELGYQNRDFAETKRQALPFHQQMGKTALAKTASAFLSEHRQQGLHQIGVLSSLKATFLPLAMFSRQLSS
jgi:hypothetical protein